MVEREKYNLMPSIKIHKVSHVSPLTPFTKLPDLKPSFKDLSLRNILANISLANIFEYKASIDLNVHCYQQIFFIMLSCCLPTLSLDNSIKFIKHIFFSLKAEKFIRLLKGIQSRLSQKPVKQGDCIPVYVHRKK